MSGHSKWSKIKRKKGANDAKRGKIFGRVIKEISVAVKEGGSPDPNFNPRLRLAIANAKGVNMPKENVQRAIKKASESTSTGYAELTYEGYAPGGVAIFVECLTDNTNRTIANVRAIFRKNNGSLATSGSVAFLFDRKGIFEFPQGDWDLDDLELELIDGGAEDIEAEEGDVVVTTDMGDFGNMQKKLEELKIETRSASLQRIPQTTTKLEVEAARTAMRLIDKFEDDDDVQAVYHNLELDEQLLAALEAES